MESIVISMETKKRRSWASSGLFIIFIGLSVTGVLSFLVPYGATLSGLHTWFALLFLLFMGFHLRNNLSALWHYFQARGGKRAYGIASLLAVTVLFGVVIYLPPFSSVIEVGYNIRNIRGVEVGQYQTVFTRLEEQGPEVMIALRAGSAYESEPQPIFPGIMLPGLTYRSTPQVAFWLEDATGNYLQTLYVTEKISNSSFGSLSGELQRRPEALPYWSHKQGARSSDGLMIPDIGATEFDGVTAATPTGHYDVNSVLSASSAVEEVKILMEINRSYDFNATYHPDRFPNDPVYSGSGSSGQPSLIYRVAIDLQAVDAGNAQTSVMELVGRGHHSGANGELYADLQGIDTALALIEYVVVTVKAQSQSKN